MSGNELDGDRLALFFCSFYDILYITQVQTPANCRQSPWYVEPRPIWLTTSYAQKQLLLSARLSHRNSVCPSVCHTGGSVKNGAR